MIVKIVYLVKSIYFNLLIGEGIKVNINEAIKSFLVFVILSGSLFFTTELSLFLIIGVSVVLTGIITYIFKGLSFSSTTKTEKLLDLSEDLSFEAQQLIWLIDSNNEKTKNLYEIFEGINNCTHGNLASIEEVTAGIQELSASSEMINEKANKAEKISNEVYKKSSENKKSTEENSEILLEVSNIIREANESINSLKKVAKNINQLLDDIKDITGQIDLLALNASIEAARAGKAGQGFTVVAEEIKNLSGETDELTVQIQDTIEEIEDGIENTSDAIEAGADKIDNVEQISKETVESFVEINNGLEELQKFVAELSSYTSEQSRATHESSLAVESISEQTTDVCERIDQTYQIVEEQSKNSEKVADYSKSLNQIGKTLHNISVEDKDDNILIFGVNPFSEPTVVKDLYVPIIEEIGKKLGKKTKTIIVADYKALTNYIKDGLVDIGWFSPMAYVEAKRQVDLTPLVTPVIGGEASYNGYIITNKDYSYSGVNDLGGTSFGFVDPLSASGYIYPKALLEEAGIDIEEDLKSTHFLGNHIKVIKAVANKDIDAGATYNEAWERAIEAGDIPMDSLKIIKKTEAIPKDAIAAKKLSSRFMKKIQNAFTELVDDQEGRNKLTKAGIDDFVISQDSNYDIVRSCLEKE